MAPPSWASEKRSWYRPSMRKIFSTAARRLDGSPIPRSSRPAGTSSHHRSRQRRNLRSVIPSLSAASIRLISLRSCRSSKLSNRICRTRCSTAAPPNRRSLSERIDHALQNPEQITNQPHHFSVSFDSAATQVADFSPMTDDAPPRRPILTAEDVVRRIAAECAFVDERGSVGIRLEPAIAIVRLYGEQFRNEPPARRPRRPAAAAPARQPALLLPISGARAAPKPGRS